MMARVPVLWDWKWSRSMPPLVPHTSRSCFPCTEFQQMSEQQTDSDKLFLMPPYYYPCPGLPRTTKQLLKIKLRTSSIMHVENIPKYLLALRNIRGQSHRYSKVNITMETK